MSDMKYVKHEICQSVCQTVSNSLTTVHGIGQKVIHNCLQYHWILCTGSLSSRGATRGIMVCFPSLPPMLECGFESRMGLEFSGFSIVWGIF